MWNWLKKTFERSNPLENPNIPLGQAYELLAGVPSASGVHVCHQTALGNPAIWMGVCLVSNSVANLPLFVYTRGQNDSREKATKHPAYWLLNKEPSESFTPVGWKQTMIQHCLIHGNAYSAIMRNEFGNPQELIPLDPEVTYPIRENGRIFYITRLDNNQSLKIAFSDCLHFKGLAAGTGLVGWSLLDVMRDAIGHGIALQRYGSHFFKNGAKPGVIIELPPKYGDLEKSPDKLEAFRKMWGNVHEGLSNSHRPALVAQGTKITEIGGNNEQGQYLQSREHDLIMMADILCIPPHKVGAAISTSHNSLIEQNQAFLTDCLNYWLTMMEQECEKKLLTERQKLQDSHFIEFERKALMSVLVETNIDLIIAQYNNGLLSWKECRNLMNRSVDKPLEDGWRRPQNIAVEGEEPPAPPVAPQPPQEGPQDDQQPVDEAEDETDDQKPEVKARSVAQGLAKLTMDRLITRMIKAVESGKLDLTQHRSVFLESLEPFERATEFTDKLLCDLNAELEAVLPEQRKAVLDSIDTQKLVEELWN